MPKYGKSINTSEGGPYETPCHETVIRWERKKQKNDKARQRNLTDAEVNHPYLIKGIAAEEKGMKEFLFTLGCFEGETVTVISVLTDNYIIHVKDARYSIDIDLARAILI